MSIKKSVITDKIVLLLNQSSEPAVKGLIFSDKLEIVIGLTQARNWKTSNFRYTPQKGDIMVRLEQLPEPQRSHIAKTKLPSFDTHPWVSGPPLTQRRVELFPRQVCTVAMTVRFPLNPETIIASYPVILRPMISSCLMCQPILIAAAFNRTGTSYFRWIDCANWSMRVSLEVWLIFIIRSWVPWIRRIWSRLLEKWRLS